MANLKSWNINSAAILTICIALISSSAAAAAGANNDGTTAGMDRCDILASRIVTPEARPPRHLLVPVTKNLCVETSRFSQVTLANDKAWKMEPANQDSNGNPVAYVITSRARKALSKTALTNLTLVGVDKQIYQLVLTPVVKVDGTDMALDSKGRTLIRLNSVEWKASSPIKSQPVAAVQHDGAPNNNPTGK